MNKQEIFQGLWTITNQKQDACKAEVEAIGKDHPTERGALQMRAGIYNVAIAAGLLCGKESSMAQMSKRFSTLTQHFFPKLATYYQSLSEEEQGLMEIALYPEVFMRANFYGTYYTELTEAEKEGDPQKIFRARIKKEVLEEILAMWREFRVQNNLFPQIFDGKED